MNKTAIYNFLSTLKQQAVKAVEDRCEKKLVDYRNQKADEMGLDPLVAETAKAGKALMKAQSKLAKSVGLNPKNYSAKTLVMSWEPETEEETILSIAYSHVKDDHYKKLQQEKQAKISETRNAYDEIRKTVQAMRSIRKIIEYLQSLGFKIEDIQKYEGKGEKPATPTKEVLFPCLVKEEVQKENQKEDKKEIA